MTNFIQNFFDKISNIHSIGDFFALTLDGIILLLIVTLIFIVIIWLFLSLKKSFRVIFFSFISILFHIMFFLKLNIFSPIIKLINPIILPNGEVSDKTRFKKTTQHLSLEENNALINQNIDRKGEDGIYLINSLPGGEKIDRRISSIRKDDFSNQLSLNKTLLNKESSDIEKHKDKSNQKKNKSFDKIAKTEKKITFAEPKFPNIENLLNNSKEPEIKKLEGKAINILEKNNPNMSVNNGNADKKIVMSTPKSPDFNYELMNPNNLSIEEREEKVLQPKFPETKKEKKPNKEKNTDSDNKIIKDDLKDTDLKRKKFDYDPDFGPDTLPKLHDQGRKLTLEKRKFKKFSLETPIGKVPEFSVKGFDEFNHRNYMQDVVWKVGNLWFYKYAPTSQIMFGTMRASSPIVIGFDVDNKGKIINNRFIKMGDIKSQNDAVKLTFSKIKLKNPPKGLIYRNLRITFTIYPPVKGKNVNELILIGRVYLEGEVSLPED